MNKAEYTWNLQIHTYIHIAIFSLFSKVSLFSVYIPLITEHTPVSFSYQCHFFVPC